MDVEKLIKQLRSAAKLEAYYNSEYNGLYNQTADALEKLQTELQKSEHDNVNLTGELEKVAAELEQVKRECDEAVQCIREIAKSGRVWMCPYCVHAKDTTGGIAECELDVGVCMMPYSKFEWCSPQKED